MQSHMVPTQDDPADGLPEVQKPVLEQAKTVKRVCSITSCERPHEAHGWCVSHYKRWRKYGDPQESRGTPWGLSTEQRFWLHVQKTPTCWLWTAQITSAGYGHFTGDDQRTVRAHRYAYELIVGPIANGLTLDHLCRNHACVNPGHLAPVSNSENILRGVSFSAVNARKTACIRGHTFNSENTKVRIGGGRRCRECDRDRQNSARAAIKATREAGNDRP